MLIEKYLLDLSRKITETPLPTFTNMREHAIWKEAETKKFKKMLGIDRYLQQTKTDLNIVKTNEISEEEYTIENLYFESLPNLFVTGNLYIPNGEGEHFPAILFLCGHAQTQKHHYQEHAHALAKIGFVVFMIDTIQLGEVRGIHQGTYSLGYYHWISQGYTPASIETWNAIRAIDLLTMLPQVDSNRIGVTGNSGGGATTWWVACVDCRVKAVAPSCGTGTIHSHIKDKTINGHCDCMFPNNPYQWSMIKMYSLVAPNPLLIVTPEQDKHFNFHAVQYVYKRLFNFYRSLNKEENISFVSFPGPHGYSEKSKKQIAQFFLKNLQNEYATLKQLPNVENVKKSLSQLQVYQNKVPANDRSTSVHDWFIPLADDPNISRIEDFYSWKKETLRKLKQDSFSIFEELEGVKPHRVIVTQHAMDNGIGEIKKFKYFTEKKYLLSGTILTSNESFETQEQLAIQLRSPYSTKENYELIEYLDSNWMKSCLNVRGTDVTAWSTSMNWYVRRSLALCGTTLTTLQVWDTLQGIKAIRNSFKNLNKIILSGSGEMAVVAILSALLDGQIHAVILDEVPESFVNRARYNNNHGNIELVNVLRYVDMPSLIAMLWPTSLVFLNKHPMSFRFTEELYKNLGGSTGIWRLYQRKDLKNIPL